MKCNLVSQCLLIYQASQPTADEHPQPKNHIHFHEQQINPQLIFKQRPQKIPHEQVFPNFKKKNTSYLVFIARTITLLQINLPLLLNCVESQTIPH